jgi:AraC family transcriptional regulator
MNAPEPIDLANRVAGSTALSSQGTPVCSRPADGTSLTLERHHVAPASKALPAGAAQHLVFVSLGRGRIDLERGGESIRQELSLGSVAVYPAGLPIRWSWRTPLSYSVLALDPGFLNYVACRLYGAAPGDFELLPTERNHDFGIATLLGLGREAGRADADSGWYLESLANMLAAHLLRHYGRWTRGGPRPTSAQRGPGIGGGSSVPEPVRRAVDYIHEHHAEDIDLRSIAEAVNLSPYHLARLFKQAIGTPPHRYLIQVRVQSAQALLALDTEKRSLAEVAAAAGFSDQSHLTRHFKRLLGVTPGQLTATANGRHGGVTGSNGLWNRGMSTALAAAHPVMRPPHPRWPSQGGLHVTTALARENHGERTFGDRKES